MMDIRISDIFTTFGASDPKNSQIDVSQETAICILKVVWMWGERSEMVLVPLAV